MHMRHRLGKQLETNHDTVSLLTSEVSEERLKNGMRIFVKQVYPASVVNLAVWVRVGSIYEDNRIAGISHFIEHMLFKGTEKRAVGEIAREIHACGGYMNAFTDFECTCYWIVLPSKFLDVALEVQADALLHSTFDETELQKECQVIIEELKMYEDQPESFAFQKLLALAFQKHPYGRPIIGFEDSLRRMTRQDLIDYYRKHYFASNIFVTVVGDVNPTRVQRKIKNTFQEMEIRPSQEVFFESEPDQLEFRVQELKGDIARSYLQLGFHVPSALHEDYYPLRVLSILLGEGRSSRLNLSLREKKQLVDSVETGIFVERHPGLFYFSFMLDEKNLEKAEQAVWNELKRLQQELVSPEELLKAKNMAESGYFFSQETVEGQGRILGYNEMLGDYKRGEKYVENIFKVTAEDIQRVAQTYFSRNNCSEIRYYPGGHKTS
jgi:zinc protease